MSRPFANDPSVMAMEVPVRAKKAGVVVMRGDGLPDRIGIGAYDLPEEDWLSIENRGRTGPLYQSVQVIRQGIVALAGTATKGAMIMGGHTVGEGSATTEREGGTIEISEEEPTRTSAAWLGEKEDGTAFLVVAHSDWDSFQIRGALAPHIAGAFHLRSVYAGTFEAAPDLAIFGWPLLLQKEGAPEPIRTPRA